MNRADQALRTALAAVERLPPKLQRQLVQRLIGVSTREGRTTVVYLQQLPPEQQRRLATLLDRSNEGKLTRAERSELRRLGSAAARTLLTNSQALARAMRPELFNDRGRPIARRFRQALGDVAVAGDWSRPRSATA